LVLLWWVGALLFCDLMLFLMFVGQKAVYS
jgi:hypothetical protein